MVSNKIQEFKVTICSAIVLFAFVYASNQDYDRLVLKKDPASDKSLTNTLESGVVPTPVYGRRDIILTWRY